MEKTDRFFVADLAKLAQSPRSDDGGGDGPCADVPLPPDEARHACRVLRLHAGAPVELFDGARTVAAGRIITTGPRGATVRLERVETRDRVGPAMHVAFAVPKGKRLDWLLEKATELGAASLQPLRFARSVAVCEELSGGKGRRWLGHCIAAAKQCGLDLLPEIRQPTGLGEFLEGLAGGTVLLLGEGDDARALNEVLSRAPQQCTSATILVGPEGGLTDTERAAVVEVGFLPVRIGHTTLRVETAVVALLAAVVAGLQ